MTRARDVVLLLTHSADHFTVDRVADALQRRGLRPFRFDTDRHPAEVRLVSRLDAGRLHHRLTDGASRLETDEVRAVWVRKIWTSRLPDDLDPRFRDGCLRESRAALMGFLDALDGVPWLDRLERATAAENKLRQLRLAIAVGLETPRTLCTNDPDEARAFFAALDGAVVAKLLTPLSTSMGKAPLFVYTSEVSATDLDDAESLRHSPMVFQQRIDKARELRVVFVAGRLFSGAVAGDQTKGGHVDWRRGAVGAWQPAALPDEVAGKLTRLMAALELSFGAIDLIETPDGRHVFLEVNPSGEWGMLERDLALPISEAIAETLST